MTIRLATHADIPFLRAMIWEAVLASPAYIAAHHGLDALHQAEDQRWSAWQPAADPAFIAVNATGRSVGALTLRPHGADAGSGWQLGLGVVAEARGHGVGRQLVEHAIAFLQTRQAGYLTLFVDEVNAPAVALYRCTGFVAVGVEQHVIEMRVVFATS